LFLGSALPFSLVLPSPPYTLFPYTTLFRSILLDLQKDIRKTIVFITHDLDEALRLGDRIAILRDGKMVQQGTGQEIVMSPADGYIESFVEHVNRGKVIRVETVMQKGAGTPGLAPIPATALLEDAAKQLIASNAAQLQVTDAS